MITGEQLQKLRALKGIKQNIIAKKLGISQPRYSEIEKKKKIDGELLKNLLAALNYTEAEVEKIKRFTPPPVKSKKTILHHRKL